MKKPKEFLSGVHHSPKDKPDEIETLARRKSSGFKTPIAHIAHHAHTAHKKTTSGFNLSDKIREWMGYEEKMINAEDVKKAVKELKEEFRKLSQRTEGGLDEFFDEIDKIFGKDLI